MKPKVLLALPLIPLAALAALAGEFGDFTSAAERMQTAAAGMRIEGTAPPALNPRCAPEKADGAKIFSGDFRWSYTLPELKARFEEMYASDKRLPKRAFWNVKTARYELPFDEGRGGAVVLPARLVESVSKQIETAFAEGYVDAVFFPDMGHTHLLIPEAVYADTYTKFPVKRFSDLYSAMFADSRIEIFYHTAEQLKTREEDDSLVTDPRTQFRYKTRNIAGLNDGSGTLHTLQAPDSKANTVSKVPGKYWWGGGFNLSANKNGCFSYTTGGKTFNFDISLFDLEPDPSTNGGGWGDY